MSEPRIGRVLVASLHQAIGEELPFRLEFYENWLNVSGLREGTIGLAPLSAVLSFLRAEPQGEAYNRVMARAGRLAADWTMSNVSSLELRVKRALPAAVRTRLALRAAGRLVRATYPGSRAVVRVRRKVAVVDLRGSLFCEVRETTVLPLCGFYAASIAGVLVHFGLTVNARVTDCRASGSRKGCQLLVEVGGAGEPVIENVHEP
jgi:hypothetical protein